MRGCVGEDGPRLSGAMQNVGGRSNAVWGENIAKRRLPPSLLTTKLIQDILSASMPDLADDEVRRAWKRPKISASTSSPHLCLRLPSRRLHALNHRHRFCGPLDRDVYSYV